MHNDKAIKGAKLTMVVSLVVGIVLATTGLLFKVLEINFLSDSKAMFALSLLPLSLAFASFVKLSRIKRAPQKMRSIIIRENDERLVALNYEADAKSFKILQGSLFLTYFGYTFIFPEEVFRSAGWWILMIILLGSMFLQLIFRQMLCKNKVNEEMN